MNQMAMVRAKVVIIADQVKDGDLTSSSSHIQLCTGAEGWGFKTRTDWGRGDLRSAGKRYKTRWHLDNLPSH